MAIFKARALKGMQVMVGMDEKWQDGDKGTGDEAGGLIRCARDKSRNREKPNHRGLWMLC